MAVMLTALQFKFTRHDLLLKICNEGALVEHCVILDHICEVRVEMLVHIPNKGENVLQRAVRKEEGQDPTVQTEIATTVKRNRESYRTSAFATTRR